jgi:hypothetical protein
VNGDYLRGLTLPWAYSGYLASDVDPLLSRLADELDAGRPVGDLVAGAAFRRPEPVTPRPGRRRRDRPRAYNTQAVDWLLDQVRRGGDGDAWTLAGGDPWCDVTPWDYSSCPPADAYPGLACDKLPGTRLRFVRTGMLTRELRTGEPRKVVANRLRFPWSQWSQPAVVRTGGRTFTSRRVLKADWPGIAALAGTGHPLAPRHLAPSPGATAAAKPEGIGAYRGLRVLADGPRQPALGIGGQNFNYSANACIMLPRGRWLQFPVRGYSQGTAVMSAVDEAGHQVVVYRLARDRVRLVRPLQVEIIIRPGRPVTDELLLVLAVSAPWLTSYFQLANGGG